MPRNRNRSPKPADFESAGILLEGSERNPMRPWSPDDVWVPSEADRFAGVAEAHMRPERFQSGGLSDSPSDLPVRATGAKPFSF